MRGMNMKIRMNKKIGIGAAVAVGAVAIVGAVAKAFGEHGRKSFYKGLDVGKLIGDFTTAEKFAHRQAEMHRKYDALCKEHEVLKECYDDLSSEFDEMVDFYEGE